MAVAFALLTWLARPATAGDVSPSPLMSSLSPAAATTAPTPSQQDNTQLDQLFGFEVTPNICATGEGYLSGQFDYLEYRKNTEDRQYRFQLQGQYGVANQLAIGGYVPFVVNRGRNYFPGYFDFGINNGGGGDLVLYGQYKGDRRFDPKLFSLTAQVSVVLPIGDEIAFRDTGHFGVRPLLLAYKDLGTVAGPGRLGAYALLGFTISNDSDVRWGLAATYEYEKFIGVLEFSGNDGSNFYGDINLFTPGLVYRGFDHLEVAVGLPIGLTNDSPSIAATPKVTYAFPPMRR